MISFGIIGHGRLGGTLATALHPLWVVTHSEQNADQLRRSVNYKTTVYSSVESIEILPDCLFITVPDSQIANVAREFSVKFGNKLSGHLIIHCSGALSAHELESCHSEGAKIAAVHPFQTFTTSGVELLLGIAWGIECSQDDEKYISSIICMLGGSPIILTNRTRELKAVYHATAVVASNFITMLIATAQEFANVAGIDEQLFLEPIIRQAVENSLGVLGTNLTPPLTGPIARGDSSTLAIHVEVLKNYPELSVLYTLLSKATVIIAQKNKLINPKQVSEFQRLLEE